MLTHSAKLAVLLIAILAIARGIIADEAHAQGNVPGEDRLLDGLLKRRLFELAEIHCRRKLNAESATEASRAQAAIDYARTLAEQAMHSPPSEREPLWAKARQVLADFGKQYPRSPRLLLVRGQDALTLLTRSEQIRQEQEVAASGAEPLEVARQKLREAIAALEELDADIEKQLRRRDPRAPSDLSEDELIGLSRTVRWQRARAFRNQALTYTDDTNRINSLTQAIDQLTPLARTAVADDLIWQAKLDEIVCLRLLGQADTALARIAALQAAEAPSAIVMASLAEQIRLALAARKYSVATDIIAEGQKATGNTSSELASKEFDEASLETMLALWKIAAKEQQTDDAKRYLSLATDLVKRIEVRHGPYYRRRAESLLAAQAGSAVSSTGGEPIAGELELLLRIAKEHVRRERWDEAIDAYAKAGKAALFLSKQDKARGAELAEQAFKLHFAAGTIAYDHKKWLAARDQFRALAQLFPEHEQSARIHLSAVVAGAQLLKESPADQQAARLSQYEELLNEHLRAWPSGATSDQARWWLGPILQQRKAWSQMAATYAGVSPGSANYERAVRSAAQAYQQSLAALQAAGKPREAELNAEIDAAGKYLESVIFGSGDRLPEKWTPAMQLAAQTLVQLRMDYPAQRLDRAALVLRELIKHSPELSQAAKFEMDWIAARFLSASGKRDEALASYRALAAANPDHGAMRTEYARLLSQTADAASAKLALDQWRAIVERTRPNTPPWYEGKYHVALALFRTGERKKAGDLIRLVRGVHGDWSKEPLRDYFEKLLAACEK